MLSESIDRLGRECIRRPLLHILHDHFIIPQVKLTYSTVPGMVATSSTHTLYILLCRLRCSEPHPLRCFPNRLIDSAGGPVYSTVLTSSSSASSAWSTSRPFKVLGAGSPLRCFPNRLIDSAGKTCDNLLHTSYYRFAVSQDQHVSLHQAGHSLRGRRPPLTWISR